MYRARVEQVNGINVRAGGKWLRSIGNRAVTVGDMIYTDGKIVYGYDKESMTPPVIAELPKVEESIPVFAYSNFATIFKRNKFNFIETNFFNVETPFIINDSNGQIYMFQRSQNLFSANCDNKGNIYSISSEYDTENYNTANVKIQKNSDVLFSTNYGENIDQEIETAISLAENISGESYDAYWSYDSGLIWARIENADSWAFIFLAVAGASSRYWSTSTAMTREAYATAGTAYYCDSSGKTAILYNFENAVSYRAWAYYYNRKFEISNYNIVDLQNINFPCQDGYTFRIDDLIALPPNIYGVPQYANISIYTPTNQKLCSFKSTAISEITIKRISGQKHLIGITPIFIGGWESDVDYIGVPYDDDCIIKFSSDDYHGTHIYYGSPLFLCDNGRLNNTYQPTNNQYLRFARKIQSEIKMLQAGD